MHARGVLEAIIKGFILKWKDEFGKGAESIFRPCMAPRINKGERVGEKCWEVTLM
jgi:hypothetical protein